MTKISVVDSYSAVSPGVMIEIQGFPHPIGEYTALSPMFSPFGRYVHLISASCIASSTLKYVSKFTCFIEVLSTEVAPLLGVVGSHLFEA